MIKNYIKKKKVDYLNHLSALGSKEITFIYILFLITIEETQLAFQIFLALTLIYIIGIPIRIFYKKERPKQKPRHNLFETIEANSFPSMHAARSTSISLLLIKHFAYNPYLITLLIIILTSIFSARIQKKRHDLTDIIGGIILGIISTLFL